MAVTVHRQLPVLSARNLASMKTRCSGSKGDTYKKLRTYIQKFKEKNGSCICRELKGVETGKVLCSCPQCITDAVALTEEYLAENR